jgi:hypothetical protein
VAIVILLAVAVVVGGALLMSGDGDGGDGSPMGSGDAAEGGQEAEAAGDPAQAVLDYLEAAQAGDCGRIVQLITESSLVLLGTTDLDEARGICQGMVDGGDELAGAGVSVQSSVVTANDGTTATVELEATADGDTETTQIQVRNEGGSWKVDLSAMSGGTSPPGGGGSGAAPEREPVITETGRGGDGG